MTVPFTNPNNRIFYACQGVFVEERNTETGNGGNPTTATFLTGVQSVGVSSDNTSRSLVDIGRFQRKYTQYGQQTLEITIDRLIHKGANLFYNVDTANYVDSNSYSSSHLLNSNNFGSKGAKDNNAKTLRNYDVTILYGPEFSRLGGGSGGDPDQNNVISVTYPNCLITSISYSIGINEVRESISLRTRNIKYNDDYSDITQYTLPTPFPEEGNILKRQNFDLTENAYGNTRLPTEVKQLFNFNTPIEKDGLQILGIQSISIDASFDYTDFTDNGIWRGSESSKEYEQNRWTVLNLPVQVSCSFTGVARQYMPYNNFLNGAENRVRNVDNIYTKSVGEGASTDWQEADREIKIVALGAASPQDYFIWDLGKKNYLTSIDYSGGDTGGGNVEATINYSNQYSDFVLVKHTSVLDLTNNGPY